MALCSVLQARGYFLKDENDNDYNSENIFLSGDSHPHDCNILDGILQRYKIGKIVSHKSDSSCITNKWEICVNSEFPKGSLNSKLTDVFLSGGRGACDTGVFHDWSLFLDDYYVFRLDEIGESVPADDLEPFVARFVRTLNTIGVSTRMSCDGHCGVRMRGGFGKSVIIQFTSIYDSIWFHLLMEKFVSPEIRISKCWRIGEVKTEKDSIINSLIITPKSNWIEIYLEIQKVATVLYKRRFELRKHKQNYFSKLSKEDFIQQVKEKYKAVASAFPEESLEWKDESLEISKEVLSHLNHL